MQRYSFFLISWFLGLITGQPIYAQSAQNQLFIIETSNDYLTWISEHPTQYLVKLEQCVVPVYGTVPYAGKDNFTGTRLYQRHAFWVSYEAGMRLGRVQDSLKKQGLSLYFFDTYRPYDVTKKMWEKVPDERYAANPARGSAHNRGTAVDVSIADLKTGLPLAMPTPFDYFSDSAHHGYSNLPAQVIANRELLKSIMSYYGFKPLATEWWHYSLPNSADYPVLNISFKALEKMPLPGACMPKQ